MKEYFCKWCSREIIHEETRVGRHYCSKACQVADLGRKGAEEENATIIRESKEEFQEKVVELKKGCAMIPLALGAFVVIFIIWIIVTSIFKGY